MKEWVLEGREEQWTSTFLSILNIHRWSNISFTIHHPPHLHRLDFPTGLATTVLAVGCLACVPPLAPVPPFPSGVGWGSGGKEGCRPVPHPPARVVTHPTGKEVQQPSGEYPAA